MKIKKTQLTEKDKRKAYKTAVRKAEKESGRDRVTASRVYKNRKKYDRKGKYRILRDENAQE